MSEFTFTVDNEQEITDAFREIFLSPLGEMYKRDFYSQEMEEEHTAKILRAAQTLTGSENITVNAMARGLELLISAGEIRPREEEVSEELVEPEEDVRPRDRNGRLLTEAQVKWSEYRQFAETASMAEISLRKKQDPGFANFVRKNLEREMAGGVGDAVTPVGTPSSRVAPTQELTDFARKYQVEPYQNLKPRNGVVLLAGEQVPYNRFIDMVNRATSCGLL